MIKTKGKKQYLVVRSVNYNDSKHTIVDEVLTWRGKWCVATNEALACKSLAEIVQELAELESYYFQMHGKCLPTVGARIQGPRGGLYSTQGSRL